MINADFFRKSPEIFERVFAAVVAISGLAAAAVRSTSSILASDFTFLAISCAILSFASYIIRSRNQKVDSHSLPWVIMAIAAVVTCIFLSVVGFLLFTSRNEEAEFFRIAPVAVLDSDTNNNSFGWYAVIDDNKSGYDAVFLTLLMQIKLINLQNFVSRIDSLYTYQSETESGPWIKLCPVVLSNASITSMDRDTTAVIGLLKPLGDVLDYVHPLSVCPGTI
jgi:hypothetical protein